jgi:tRNA isopentenyl-2-thiomethyl-A-37 hydroxylase MiaE
MKKDGSRKDALCDRLLFSAMIEARSCERFKVLSENIKDPELAKFIEINDFRSRTLYHIPWLHKKYTDN